MAEFCARRRWRRLIENGNALPTALTHTAGTLFNKIFVLFSFNHRRLDSISHSTESSCVLLFYYFNFICRYARAARWSNIHINEVGCDWNIHIDTCWRDIIHKDTYQTHITHTHMEIIEWLAKAPGGWKIKRGNEKQLSVVQFKMSSECGNIQRRHTDVDAIRLLVGQIKFNSIERRCIGEEK